MFIHFCSALVGWGKNRQTKIFPIKGEWNFNIPSLLKKFNSILFPSRVALIT